MYFSKITRRNSIFSFRETKALEFEGITASTAANKSYPADPTVALVGILAWIELFTAANLTSITIFCLGSKKLNS